MKKNLQRCQNLQLQHIIQKNRVYNMYETGQSTSHYIKLFNSIGTKLLSLNSAVATESAHHVW